MKTIGIIGGMSWESTVPYYRLINEGVKERLGGLHSAHIVMVSVDFHDIAELQNSGRWDEAGDAMVRAARALEVAGADCVVIATNTMHTSADRVADAVSIPLLHIADATGEAIVHEGIRTVGLLGTRFTMEQDFYRTRLAERFGLEVLVPGPEDREFANRVIYTELCCGVFDDGSRARFREIIGRLVSAGAGGIVLGCTEIPLLVTADDSPVPLFDTGKLHAAAAVAFALAEA